MLQRKSLLPLLLLALVASAGAVHADVALLDAVKNGDVARFQELLAGGAAIEPGPDGATPLHWAVYLDAPEMVDVLVERGADVNAANRLGVRPLSLACVNGSAAVVKRLLAAGADPKAPLRGGETPLLTASRTGNVEVVELLLAAGAEVDRAESWRGQTPLMWAAAEGHVAVIDALVEHGAAVGARSTFGFTPLLFAVREGRIDAARALLRSGANVADALPEERPFAIARAKKKPPDFETFDERGRRTYDLPPGIEVSHQSALLIAVQNAHYELASLLLDAGADPNDGTWGWVALHQIVWARKAGVGNNMPEPKGSGSMDSLELVRRLAAHGADVNARITRRVEPVKFCSGDFNYIGATPFLLATKTADLDLMRLLLSLGADPSLADADGVTPLLAAAGVGTHNAGEDAGTEPEVLEALRFMLDLGADINAVDRNGESAMHGAAYRQFPAVVRFLIEKGARIEVWNREDKFGWTPLTIASGVQRCNNIQGSEATAAVIREVMDSAAPTATTEVSRVRSP